MATQPILTSQFIPSQDERTMAFLAHLLQIFTGFMGPLVIFLIKQNSRFVRFHSLQALIWQVSYIVLFLLGFAFAFILIFASIFQEAVHSHSQNPPIAFFLIFPLAWLFAVFGWVANLTLGIVYGIKANRGEWATYPIIGKWLLPKLDSGAQPPSQPWMP